LNTWFQLLGLNNFIIYKKFLYLKKKKIIVLLVTRSQTKKPKAFKIAAYWLQDFLASISNLKYTCTQGPMNIAPSWLKILSDDPIQEHDYPNQPYTIMFRMIWGSQN